MQIGQNYIAKQASLTRSGRLRNADKIGSIPFGLPTEAIYNRKQRDMDRRNRILLVNSRLVKFMKMEPVRQILFLPEF